MSVLKLRKQEAAPIEYDAVFDWRDIAVGRRLVYSGEGYDKPAVFDLTGVMRAWRWRRERGAEVCDPVRDRVEVRCGEDVRLLGAAYVYAAARWALVREG